MPHRMAGFLFLLISFGYGVLHVLEVRDVPLLALKVLETLHILYHLVSGFSQ